MTILIDCPKCRTGEFEVELKTEYQGEGAWAMNMEFWEITEQSCPCPFSSVELEEIAETADRLRN